MNEVVGLSAQLGKRVGELGIPVYLYEYSAANVERKNLAYLRKGEYEMIEEKIKLPEWNYDFGEQIFNAKFGAMARKSISKGEFVRESGKTRTGKTATPRKSRSMK